MEKYMQIKFRKNGKSVWEKIGGPRTLTEFNSDFEDWVFRYFEFEPGEEVRKCQTWDDALEVLNTVGASAMAGQFELEEVGF